MTLLGQAALVWFASLSALAVIPTPTPAPIPSILKPNYVPKRLTDYDDKPIMVLLEADRQVDVWASRAKAEPIKVSQLLPNRVYLYYVPRDQRWHQVITDSYGKLKRSPMEYLRASTVVPGSFLGAKNAAMRYILGRDKIWLPTSRPERYEFWVESSPPLAKYVEYEPMPLSAPSKAGGK